MGIFWLTLILQWSHPQYAWFQQYASYYSANVPHYTVKTVSLTLRLFCLPGICLSFGVPLVIFFSIRQFNLMWDSKGIKIAFGISFFFFFSVHAQLSSWYPSQQIKFSSTSVHVSLTQIAQKGSSYCQLSKLHALLLSFSGIQFERLQAAQVRYQTARPRSWLYGHWKDSKYLSCSAVSVGDIWA